MAGELERRPVAGGLHVGQRGGVPQAVGVGEQVDVVADDLLQLRAGLLQLGGPVLIPVLCDGWWSQVWAAIAIPAASRARTSSRESQFGRSRTTVMTKNVAGIPRRCRIGSALVYWPPEASSKDSITGLSGSAVPNSR